MKCKYLIQWEECKYDYIREYEHAEITNHIKVLDLTNKELEEFCKDKEKLKVTFICIVPAEHHKF